ncbi:MAG: class I SAM-dependent methyltransferase [bacterium]|nr:class I SAM-dependent methyltransferase [bacterium]
MGYLRDKYTRAYFLGSTSTTGKPVGVAGYEEFRLGGIAPRFVGYLRVTAAEIGGFCRKSVLDIGCGRGEMLYLSLGSDAAHVVGIDFSRAALDIVTSWIQSDRLQLLQQEANSITFDAEFDVVFLLDVVEHIPRWEINEVYARARKSLRHGGVVVVHTPLFRTSDEHDCTAGVPEVEGMHCNKQTFAKLLGACRRHSMVPVAFRDDVFVLRRAEDCSLSQRIRATIVIEWHGFSRTLRRFRGTLRQRAAQVVRLILRRGPGCAIRVFFAHGSPLWRAGKRDKPQRGQSPH